MLRKMAIAWLTAACECRILLNDESIFKRMLELMQQVQHQSMSRAMSDVVGNIVAGGQAKYYKLMVGLCQHADPLVRINVVLALTAPTIKQIPAPMYQLATFTADNDKLVRMATIRALSNMPAGCREASTPLFRCLEDDESDVRFLAAETLVS